MWRRLACDAIRTARVLDPALGSGIAGGIFTPLPPTTAAARRSGCVPAAPGRSSLSLPLRPPAPCQGLNKAETAERHGDEQVGRWKRNKSGRRAGLGASSSRQHGALKDTAGPCWVA